MKNISWLLLLKGEKFLQLGGDLSYAFLLYSLNILESVGIRIENTRENLENFEMLNKFCLENSLSPAVDISEDLVQSYSILCILDETVINIAELNTKVHIIFAPKKNY